MDPHETAFLIILTLLITLDNNCGMLVGTNMLCQLAFYIMMYYVLIQKLSTNEIFNINSMTYYTTRFKALFYLETCKVMKVNLIRLVVTSRVIRNLIRVILRRMTTLCVISNKNKRQKYI